MKGVRVETAALVLCGKVVWRDIGETGGSFVADAEEGSEVGGDMGVVCAISLSFYVHTIRLWENVSRIQMLGRRWVWIECRFSPAEYPRNAAAAHVAALRTAYARPYPATKHAIPVQQTPDEASALGNG